MLHCVTVWSPSSHSPNCNLHSTIHTPLLLATSITRPSVRKAANALAPAFALVTFDLDNMPKIERKAVPPKNKEEAQKISADTRQRPAKQSPYLRRLIFESGILSTSRNIPTLMACMSSKSILARRPALELSFSGLVHYISLEQMRDRDIIIVCKLKPANMRGMKSFAMEAGIELVQPPPGSKPSDRVYFEGEKFENATPLSQLNPKEKIFETIRPGFATPESKEAAWVDPVTKSVHKIRTANDVCVARTLIGASLS
ncbi:ARC1_2 [Sanghuangporus weigelae]